jgi:hypothetical protein
MLIPKEREVEGESLCYKRGGSKAILISQWKYPIEHLIAEAREEESCKAN